MIQNVISIYITKKLIVKKLYLWLQFLGDLMCFHLFAHNHNIFICNYVGVVKVYEVDI
jgi:hypothetical protein